MVARFVTLIILRGAWLSLMILTPLFGFWLASSLAAYNNGSQWLNLLLGLALFPLVPVGWELISVWRRSRQEQPGKQYLTRIDRLVLRTLIVNGVFLAVILYFSRATAFTALGQRGDWMLDGHDGPVASTIRGFLLGIADQLDGKKLAPSDRYGESDEAPQSTMLKEEDTPQPVKPGEVTPPKTTIGWPLDDAPDDKVTNMPEAAKVSIATVGAYMKEQFSDKKLRVKAIHDFVALRLVYDEKALEGILKRDFANVPPQTAEAVFAAKTGVCEGYARLMTAIGAAANIEIKYVTGYIRDASRRVALGSDASIKAALEGYGHAWNAVLLDGEWFLIDATWDDPSGSADKPVRSTYLFTPPKLFAYDHLPEDPAWQLVLKPISEGDFARLPMIAPEIGRYGLTLESPNRSQVSVSGRVEIILANPYGAQLLASAKPERGGTEVTCKDSSTAGKTTVTCDLDAGEFEVRLFAAPAGTRAGRYGYIGSILVNSR